MIHHTNNDTTITCGQSTATVIADSISSNGKRITTFELVYPRYIHSEFMTHRMFSRNASSSRATPLSVTLDEVENDPVFFDYVGKNQSGMVAGEKLSNDELKKFEQDWKRLGNIVAYEVDRMYRTYNVHKQTLNRALEAWLRIRTLVTATDWDNFFKLRLAPDAQPEIHSLASAMKKAMDASTPEYTSCHLPYVTDDEFETRIRTDWFKISVARCARVSYARLDGKPTDYEADLALYKRLLSSGHLSPFEHVAYPEIGRFANFDGWRSLRYSLEN